MLNEIVRKVERKIAGLEDPCEKQLKRPLVEHIADFEKHLLHRQRTAQHVQETLHRIRAIRAGCKFHRIADISASRVHEFLSMLRAVEKKSVDEQSLFARHQGVFKVDGARSTYERRSAVAFDGIE